MIMNRKYMLSIDFKVLGLDFGSNTSCYNYTKYYDKQLYLLIADSNECTLRAYKFSNKKEMKAFKDGKFYITADSYKDGQKGIHGYPAKYINPININDWMNIVRIKRTKDLLKGISLFENKFINQPK